MRLDATLTQASAGLDSVQKRLAAVAQNVANANTPGYVRQTVAVESLAAGGDGYGVRTGVAARSVDTVLQGNLFAVGGQAAGGQLKQQALAAVDEAAGVVGSGQDLAGLVGGLRDAFSTLASDPANETQQRAVLNAADALARGINGLGLAVQQQRQVAQNGVVEDVGRANTALRTIGDLSDRIIQARSRGESTADLEDKRDAAMQAVAQLTGAAFLPQPNGDVLAVSGGTVLRTHPSQGVPDAGPLSIGDAALAPDTPPGVVPVLLVDGVARPVSGGRIGAALELRDTVLPGLQSGLDRFAQGLAAGFASAGIDLFTDGAGAVPAGVPAGFAQLVRVNPAAAAAPRLVRDGVTAGVIGPVGAAGDTRLIDVALRTALATGTGTLVDQAASLVAGHAGLAATAARGMETDQAVQASLQAKLDAKTGVSMDSELSEMVRLQNSYGANAKVITAVQAMWNQLLDSVR